MADWLDSADDWPRHTGCKEWNDALELAREHQWHLKPLDGHRWGVLVCRRTTESGYCKITIDRSASGTETIARSTLLEIERCPHERASDKPAASILGPAEAARILDRAEQLIRAARKCMLGHRKLAEAAHLLEEATSALDSLDLLDLAESVEGDALVTLREATAAASALSVELARDSSDVRTTHPEPALTTAKQLLDEVDGSPGESDKWDRIRTRTDGLRSELVEVKASIPQANPEERR